LAVASTADQPRRHDLDLVRVLVVAGLIVFHTACVFVPNGFYVTNRPPSYVLMMFVFFSKLWGMPLLFMVAGVGIWHSLSARSAGVFVQERLQRLLVPLLVGILVVVPPQLYYFLLASGRDPGSYRDVLRQFFDVRLTVGFPSFLTTAHTDGLFELSHLWFLYYLLVYSLLLPVFLYLRRDAAFWIGWPRPHGHLGRAFSSSPCRSSSSRCSSGPSVPEVGTAWSTFHFCSMASFSRPTGGCRRRCRQRGSRRWRSAYSPSPGCS
jgi:hypothetical protein